MATETVENYLKAIFTLRAPEDEDAPVPLGDLAAAVGVTPGTATTMVKKLADDKLVNYERYGGVTLTAGGERVALAVLRRHRLIETFLVRTLGMDWSEVHDDAERLEHALSDQLLERLDRFLGHPVVDPHGDPIPDPRGRLRHVPLTSIASCKPGARVRIARVLDQSRQFLKFLDGHAMEIGSVVTVESADACAGVVVVRVKDGVVALSESTAANLLVEPVGK